jgi:hypothetical protein
MSSPKTYEHLEEDKKLRAVYALLRKGQFNEAFALLQQMTSDHIGGTSSHDQKTDQQIAIHIASAWTVLLGSCPVKCFQRMLRACVCQVQAAICTMTDPRRKAVCQRAFWFEMMIDVIRNDEKEQRRLLVVTTTCLTVARGLAACLRRFVDTDFHTYSVSIQNKCVWKMSQQLALIQRMFVVGQYRFACPHNSLQERRQKICRVCEEDYAKACDFVRRDRPRKRRKREPIEQPA